MSKKDKLIKRFLTEPKDFTFDEMVHLLAMFGYNLTNNGRTSGSAVSFKKDGVSEVISFHRPHPGNIVKAYVIKQVKKYLKDELEREGNK